MWRESGFVGVGAPMSAWPPLAESRPCGEGQPTERDNHSAHVSALASKASQVNWCWVQYNWCEGRIPMIWHRQSLELKHVKSPRKRVKIETGTWWHHTVHIPHNEKRNLVQGPLHRKQIVNFMDINHVSEIVFLLAVAASFSVGFHNIGRHCHSIDRESHEVGLSKCHQKCLHPGIFSTASQDQKKFIVQPALILFSFPFILCFQWPSTGWVVELKTKTVRSFNIPNELNSSGSAALETSPLKRKKMVNEFFRTFQFQSKYHKCVQGVHCPPICKA